MKRMLINATQPEERRLAIVDGQKLMDFETEIEGREQRKGNIYKAVVTRVEPSLEACFVDYGEDRHGFLPFKEISKNYFREGTDARTARIQDAIRDGDNLLVQVEKEERGNKGAALTTFVSLAGRYLVLMPNNPRGGGVSRRIEGEDREELKENLDQLEYPKGMSLIARTAGIGRTAPELQWDLNYMLKLWTAIDGASGAGKGAFLIYQESSLVIRAIRDYFTADIGEILIDTDDIFDQAQQFMQHVMPETASKVKRYRDDAALFSRFQIEHQIETAFARTVNLPSGGAIVIDHTEALVSVDVNSARSTRGSDIEETATRTNLEAADEIARQMRLRDLGGLIVVDFIDMDESKNRREVETRLRDALRSDRARVQFSSISKFGLLELSRQRLRPALSEGSHITCPRCNGTGHIRDTESSALQIMRMVQEESMKENTAAVHVQVPVEVTSFLLNEKRTEITKIELKQRVTVLLVPNKNLETPNYRLERLRHDDPRLENLQASYTMIDDVDDEVGITRREKAKPKREPVIKGILPETPAPQPAARAEAKAPVEVAPVAAATVSQARTPSPVAAPPAPAGRGFFSWVKDLFGGPVTSTTPAQTATPVKAAQHASTGTTETARRDRGDRPRGDRGGRGDRNDRGGRRDRAEAGAEAPARGRRGDGRGEAKADGRGDRAERSDRGQPRGERGRGERDDRRSDAAVQPESSAPLREGLAPGEFVDTLPGAVNDAGEIGLERKNGQPGDGGDTGEREGGARRRNRRGGRGRDRRDGPAGDAQAADDSMPSDLPGAVDAPHAQSLDDHAPIVEPTAGDGGSAEPIGHDADGGDRPAREGGRRRRGGRGRGSREGGANALDAASTGHPDAPAQDAIEQERAHEPGFAADEVRVPDVEVARAEQANEGTGEVPVETHDDDARSVVEPAVAHASDTPDERREKLEAAVAPVTTSHAIAPDATLDEDYALPVESLQTVAETAGLQWVVSDPGKIESARAALAAEPAPPRVQREAKPPASLDDGPLVLVETSKDLSQVRLPFENAGPASS